MLNTFRISSTPRQQYPPKNKEDGLQFVQSQDENIDDSGAVLAQSKGNGGRDKSKGKGDSKCFHCGSLDHWIRECPTMSADQKAHLFMQLDGAMISQVKGDSSGGLNKHYLYLDTCTTNDQVVVKEYLQDVCDAPAPLALHTNAGTSTSTQHG